MEYSTDKEKIADILCNYQMEECFTDLKRYSPHFKIFQAAKRERIFGDAERKKEIYILLSGKVKVCTTLGNGRQLLLDYYEKRELFGEHILAAVPVNDMNCFYTEAVSPVTGLALYVTPVKELLANDVKFLHFYINCLQTRFNQLGNVQPMNVLNSSERNVAGYIWSKRIQSDVKEAYCFRENLREVAELLGISYRHLHRVLKRLVENGILERTNQGYLVSDVNALLEIVERQ